MAYQSLDALGRRALHLRLATLVGEEEGRARHLALGSSQADATVAAVLERAAEHARARGASATEADPCEQACRLTPPDRVRDLYRRRVATARYRFAAGDTRGARELLEHALSTAATLARAGALTMLGRVHEFEGHQLEAAALFRRALAEAPTTELGQPHARSATQLLRGHAPASVHRRPAQRDRAALSPRTKGAISRAVRRAARVPEWTGRSVIAAGGV